MLLRDAISRGHAIGQIAVLSDAELKALDQKSAEVVRAFPAKERANGPDLKALIEAIEDFDAAAANEEIGRMAALMPASDLVMNVALPLMREVGDRWHHGVMTIAHEHMASAVLRNLFGSLLRLYKPLDPIVKIVLATPSGEHHEFGILATAMLAAPLGLDAIYLGANLPADQINAAAERSGARVIVIGLKDHSADAQSLRELAKLASIADPSTELWVGGRSLSDQPSPIQDRVTVIDDFEMLERQLRRLRHFA
jgi:methanogenic corrinoid protein MtbC1